MELKIQKLTLEFVDDVVRIESELIAPTSKEKVLKTLESEKSLYFVLEKNGSILGFVEGLFLPPEAELFDIAVDKKYQGQGYSKILMDYFVSYSKIQGVETIFLEVNSINQKAINLYKKYGFEKYSERKKYYGDNDAILMKKTLL